VSYLLKGVPHYYKGVPHYYVYVKKFVRLVEEGVAE
jgi:hypothetical protein